MRPKEDYVKCLKMLADRASLERDSQELTQRILVVGAEIAEIDSKIKTHKEIAAEVGCSISFVSTVKERVLLNGRP